VSLDPEPIPLNTKVVLIGEPLLYYLLYQLDADFRELFKVTVDFESSMDRAAENDTLYARLIGTLARKAGVRPFSAAGVARVLEHGARVVGDAGKLWLALDRLTDLLKEADHWAGAAGRSVAEAADGRRSKGSSTSARREAWQAGVLIPSANKRHLMLRADVIEAVAAGMFHIYAIETVDQGMQLLTGMPAGGRDVTGQFLSGTVNHLVEQRLIALARQARAFKVSAEEPVTGPGLHMPTRRS
jgi:predicted ATP-dependent protease